MKSEPTLWFQTTVASNVPDIEWAPGAPAAETVDDEQIVNLPPIVQNTVFTRAEDTNGIYDAIEANALGTDPEGEDLFFDRSTTPLNGSVTIFASGYLLGYTPNPNFFGTETIQVWVSDRTDQGSEQATATVTFVVTPENDAPVAVDDGPFDVVAGETITLTGNILNNDSDIDDDPLTVVAVATAQPSSFSALGIADDGAGVSFTVAPDAIGEKAFTYTVADPSGSTSTATVTLQVAAPPDLAFETVYAVNIGSAFAYTAKDGTVFAADDLGVGKRFATTGPIDGTEDDTLYESEAYGSQDLSYAFAVDPGTYLVTLHFAEIWRPAFAEDARRFDVAVDGISAVEELDLYAEVGGRTAYLLQRAATVMDGVLEIDLIGAVENAKLSAIEIERGVEVAPNAPPLAVDDTFTPNFVSDAYVDPRSGLAEFVWTKGDLLANDTDDDFDGDGFNDLQIELVDHPGEGRLLLEGNASILRYTFDPATTSGLESFSYVAIDEEGAVSNVATVTVAIDELPAKVEWETVYAVNIGSVAAYVAADSTVFAADDLGVGRRYQNAGPIEGTEDDSLYASEAFAGGALAYGFAVDPGTYRVTLHFAEIWEPAFVDGARQFDVSVEGDLIADNLDIYASAGERSAIVLQHTVEGVEDGVLNINLESVVENAKLSALQIERLIETKPNTGPIALDDAVAKDFATDATVDAATGLAQVVLTKFDLLANDSDDDHDGDGVSDLQIDIVDWPDEGALVLDDDASIMRFTFDPAVSTGVVSFSYVAIDEEGASSGVATVTLQIAGLPQIVVDPSAASSSEEGGNTAPVVVDDAFNLDFATDIYVDDDSGKGNYLFTKWDLFANDSDDDHDGDGYNDLQFQLVDGPSFGELELAGEESVARYIFDPLTHPGTDSLSYRAVDEEGASSDIAMLVLVIDGLPSDAPAPPGDHDIGAYSVAGPELGEAFTAILVDDWPL